MADNIVPSQQNTKFSILWQKISALSKSKSLLIGSAFLLAGAGMLAYRIFHKTEHEKATEIVNKASDQVQQGDFNEAIQNLLDAYDKEPKLIVKAGIAYKIGVKYYQIGSKEEGKKWLQKSADDYTKAGDKESAAGALSQIQSMEGVQKTENINTNQTSQNANNRGNIIDGNL